VKPYVSAVSCCCVPCRPWPNSLFGQITYPMPTCAVHSTLITVTQCYSTKAVVQILGAACKMHTPAGPLTDPGEAMPVFRMLQKLGCRQGRLAGGCHPPTIQQVAQRTITGLRGIATPKAAPTPTPDQQHHALKDANTCPHSIVYNPTVYVNKPTALLVPITSRVTIQGHACRSNPVSMADQEGGGGVVW
jgi:hypothetical protein